jgi:hypothetical protein
LDSRRLSQSVARGLPLGGLLGIALLGAAIASAQTSAPSASAATPKRPTLRSVPHSQRGEQWYAARYGVDQLQVRWTASGQSVEFRYRVVDPAKAVWLNDKKASPVLTDLRAGVKLSVPQVENVGSLRQVAPPEAGKEYWMVFSNPGKRVVPGDKVDITIGPVRLNGLYVQ